MDNNISPISSSQSSSASTSSTQQKGATGDFIAKPMTFLGMHFTADEAKVLWNSIIHMVSMDIQRENKRAVAAIRKWREGE